MIIARLVTKILIIEDSKFFEVGELFDVRGIPLPAW